MSIICLYFHNSNGERGEELHSPRCKSYKGREKDISLSRDMVELQMANDVAIILASTKAEKKRLGREENAGRLLSREEQLLGTRSRDSLPRFPSSSSIFRSMNPGSSVIPRALSGSRHLSASGDSLIRSMPDPLDRPAEEASRCLATASSRCSDSRCLY